jgi:excisionase family DNA binding protein
VSATVATLEDLEPLRRELAELRQLLGARTGQTLTTEQAAEVAGVKPKTIRSWVEAGTLPARHRGRRLVIQRADLQAHLAGSLQGAATLLSDLTARTG